MGLAAKWGHDAALQADNAKRDFIRGLMKRAGYADSSLNPDIEEHFKVSLNPAKHEATPAQEWAMAKHLDYFPSGLDTTDPEAIDAWYRATRPAFDQLETREAAALGANSADIQFAFGGADGGFEIQGLGVQESEALAKHRAILKDMQEVPQAHPMPTAHGRPSSAS